MAAARVEAAHERFLAEADACTGALQATIAAASPGQRYWAERQVRRYLAPPRR
jgi:hypothetical protein